MTTFIRLLDVPVDAKPAALKAAVAGVGPIFECAPEAFAAVPGSPFAYWVSNRILKVFQKTVAFDAGARTATVGLQSSDDFRFLRLWFEPMTRAPYRPFAKGGSFSLFHADLSLSIIWDRDGHEVKAFAETTPGSNHWSRNIRSADHYLRPGLTWPRRTNGLSFRALPAGCIFADKGPAAFVAGDDPRDLLALSALLNSRAFAYLVGVQLARTELAQSYEVGLIQKTPVPPLTTDDGRPTTQAQALAVLARRAWSLRRALDTVSETSHAFALPPALSERLIGLDSAAIAAELAGLQREIDDLAFDCYRLNPEDRAAILAAAPPTQPQDRDAAAAEDADDGEVGDPADPASGGLDGERSWLVGVAFARFDPRLATGERAIPPEPEPFDPLPARSPGMYPEGEEPADRPDILVDDAGHPDDLAARAQAVAERVKVDVPEDLRGWLAREFFPLHIRMYSKSRRKAPIYWQLATPSASYSVWLYIHAFSKDTLFRVQNEYLAPKLAHEERRLEALTLELRDGATAAQRKALAEQESLVEELRDLLTEVKRVAPLWNPDLDDGVIINFAPLWRLVPQHKSWQKELKSTWDALCEGQYDWAHLAMHLWPERVVPKCATDRSLAIAHGLEAVFWEQGEDGKWRVRRSEFGVGSSEFAVQEVIAGLVHERTSTAVKDARNSLLAAPAPVSSRAAGRRGTGRAQMRERNQGAGAKVQQPEPPTPNPELRTPNAAPETLYAVKQAIAAAAGGTSKSEVLAATGLTDAQWNLAINALLAEGSVTKTGAARGTRYHLSATD